MNKIRTTKFDVADHLHTVEDMAAYLEACLEEPDADAAFIAKILAVSLLNLDQYGVSVVGTIPAGFPLPALPQVSLSDIPFLLAGAVGIVFIAIGESIGVARVYAARHHYEIDPDQELIALGSANSGCGLFQGATVDATLSSPATGDAAGGRTQVSGLPTAALIFLTVVLIAPLYRNLPQAVLGAVVITAVIGLLDVGALSRYRAMHRTDFWLVAYGRSLLGRGSGRDNGLGLYRTDLSRRFVGWHGSVCRRLNGWRGEGYGHNRLMMPSVV